MSSSPITIIGGGIAGLASALAFGKRDCLILEQAKAFSNLGAGLQLGPNAVRALQKLGAWDAVEPMTSSPPEIHMRDGMTGTLLHRLKLGKNFEHRFGAPYRVAHRADLHCALLAVVKSRPYIEIRLNESVSKVENTVEGATVISNEKTFAASGIIAADGVNSKIRELLFPGKSAIDSGEIFHRALIKPPDVKTVEMDCVNLWLYPGGHVVHYPVGAEQNLNLIAITPKAQAALQHFQHAAPALNMILENATPHFTTWAGLYAPPLQSWSIGNIVLLGDAAHATLPYLAQGAAMALEDAQALEAFAATQNNITDIMKSTAESRFDRTQKLQHQSFAMGRLYHVGGLKRSVITFGLRVLPQSILSNRLSWLYKN